MSLSKTQGNDAPFFGGTTAHPEDVLETPAERAEAAKPFVAALQKHVPRIAVPSLYEVEDDLLALLNVEDEVPPEQEEEFRDELAKQFKAAVASVIEWADLSKCASTPQNRRLTKSAD
ncbi:MAG: hypothetical protein JWO19_5723 [Bryobacterales bacterium]|jgi:hypothetical protein|nr:hypothetical protein [Bryobacterales bacterium]